MCKEANGFFPFRMIMEDKRILTIEDISCFGQCSLTVALPVISACGIETVVIPSSVLSTHTTGFSGYTFRDLTEDIPRIAEHWKSLDLKFDAIYTGYLGSKKEVSYVIDIMETFPALKIVDPAMADNGVLYPGFNEEYVQEMTRLCGIADIILPNITEACMMTGVEYKTEYDDAYIITLLKKLHALGADTVILTGVGFEKGMTGVMISIRGMVSYYEHRKIERNCHGTGDVYASTFVGALMNGKDAYTAAKIAADFTVRCIDATLGDEAHWYGVKFERQIPELIKAIQEN